MNKRNIKFCWLFIAISFLNGMVARAQDTQDSVVNVAFGKVAKEDLPGGVSSVNISDLLKKSYGTYSLDNLQSLVAGYTGNIWGQAPLVLVDGVPRRAADVRLVEVESITVLKGASSVVLYGSSAAKGVVLITTRRGAAGPLRIDVRANTGVYVPKGYPGYLKAADYMTLYNEALANDGISVTGAGYTQEQIDNTRAGSNPYKYPDIDFFSAAYLKKAYSRSDITTEISGGNENTRYYTNIGVAYNNSIMNYGQQKKNNDLAFNVRGNVDMNLTKWLSASTDAVAVVSNNYAGRGDFWGASATVTPNFNKYSPLIPIDMLDPDNTGMQTLVNNSNHIIDGKYLLGGTSSNLTSVLGDMQAAGYIKTRNRTFMYNLSATADLGSVLKGLSFKSGFSMDYASVYSEAYQLPYAVYNVGWSTVNGKDVITRLDKLGNDGNSTNEFIGKSSYTQTVSFRSQFNYDRTFSRGHQVTAALLGWWYLSQFSSDADNDGGSSYHPVRNANLGFEAGYNYRKKYYLDFAGALVHSAKLPVGNREAVSPTVSLGWRISEEDFFKSNVSFIDNLKLVASYGSIKQDLDLTNGTTDYYLYQGYYDNRGGWYQWRDGVAGGWTTGSKRGDNPALTFIKRNEFRAGVDASLFNKLITFNANYFSQETKGLLTQGSATVFPSYFSNWDFSFLPYLNFNNDKRSGMDFSVNLNKTTGQVQGSLGVVGMFFSSKATRRDEVYQDDYQYRAGKSLDAYWGYISEGLFQDQQEINQHATQTFGGVVKPGDLKYKDVNNDGVIDTRDQVNLGKNGWAASPFTYGINLTVKYKGFTLFAMGNGQAGAIGFKNSSYYWVRGAGKYSNVVWGRWTQATAGSATYPRLTTTAGNNNFQNSTFWMYKNNRFNLSRVQLTYHFNEGMFRNSFVHGLSVYVNGDNLLVVSKERKMMETNIGTAPQYRFYNAGLKASF